MEVKEAIHRTCSILKPGHGFLQQCLCSPQERWRMETRYKLKKIERFYSCPSLQNGEYQPSEGSVDPRRFLSKNQSQGCLSYCTNAPTGNAGSFSVSVGKGKFTSSKHSHSDYSNGTHYITKPTSPSCSSQGIATPSI